MADRLHCDFCDGTTKVKPRHTFRVQWGTAAKPDRTVEVNVEIRGQVASMKGEQLLDVCEADARRALSLAGVIAAQDQFGERAKSLHKPTAGTTPAEETPRDPGQEPAAAGEAPASTEPAA